MQAVVVSEVKGPVPATCWRSSRGGQLQCDHTIGDTL
jgi:hypothetical protein